MSSIQQVIENRKINGLVHFTRLENLVSILQNGIVPRTHFSDGRTNPITGIVNDDLRLDGKKHGSCFSISFPNWQMFYKYRQQQSTDWVVICILAQVLIDKEDKCAFFPKNAACASMVSLPLSVVKGHAALENMFSDCNQERGAFLLPKDTTDPQAEVMIFDVVEVDYIAAVVFSTEALKKKYIGLFPSFEDNFFVHSEGGGFFGKQEYIRNKRYKGF